MKDYQLFGALLTVVMGYACMYFTALSIVGHAMDEELGPFQVVRVLRECLGAVLRRVRRYITFNPFMKWAQVLKLNPNTATFADVEQAGVRILGNMRKRRWSYPASQRHVILRLMAQGLVHIEERDTSRQEWQRRADEWANQARFSDGRQHVPVSRPGTGWRAVLGLAPGECEVATIKKTYRKLAQRAHPDRGGSHAAMAKLNVAFDEARNELQFV